MLAHLLAQHVVSCEHVDGLETLPDAVHLQQRTLQPAPERAPTHRRAGPVYGLDQLVQAQVAPRRRVEDHPRARIVRTEGHHLLRRTAAAQRGQVLDQSPSRTGERRVPVDPVSFETGDPEVSLQRWLSCGGLNVQRGAELTAARTFGSLSATVRSGTTISRGDHRSSSAGSCSSETSVPVNSPVEASTTAMPARPSLTTNAAR